MLMVYVGRLATLENQKQNRHTLQCIDVYTKNMCPGFAVIVQVRGSSDRRTGDAKCQLYIQTVT
jgi:hypothetical protein